MRFALNLFIILSFLIGSALAQTADLQAGVDYIELDPSLPGRVEADKIEVLEFFNFSCPHCFRLQRHFKKWQKDTKTDDVTIVRQPVVFERYRGHFARVYYTIETLGDAEEYADKVYNAIHKERKLINSKERFLDWLEDEEVDRDEAEAIYDSFKTNTRAARAETISADYGIDSTPQLAVAGKYILNARLSGSYEKMMETLTALVERERKDRAKKQ